MATAYCTTPFGEITVIATRHGVRRVRFPSDTALVEDGDDSRAARELARRVAAKIEKYFAGEAVEFDEPLDLNGVPEFSCKVWNKLRALPRGQTISYAALARRAGSPKAARAVGTAMATNPVPLIVPCHRVVRSDGSLGGFGGGLPMKRRLLELEQARR